MKIAIIDFEDSFTFNIYSIIKELKIEVYVLNYKTVKYEDLLTFSHLILGPGPGEIDDYASFYPFVDRFILDALSARVKLIGICLGHQLIHSRLGREVYRLSFPVHGQAISVELPNHKFLIKKLRNQLVELQLYNSWAVRGGSCSLEFELEIEGSEGEILASFSEYITTYQFHCESIGTSFQHELFYQFLV